MDAILARPGNLVYFSGMFRSLVASPIFWLLMRGKPLPGRQEQG